MQQLPRSRQRVLLHGGFILAVGLGLAAWDRFEGYFPTWAGLIFAGYGLLVLATARGGKGPR